jgi:hypothetical protein
MDNPCVINVEMPDKVSDGVIAINAGCNDIQLEGHLNVDLDENNNPQLICDVAMLDKVIPHGTIRHIYAGHLLEHLNNDQGEKFLQACKNILAPHGVLTVVVPDWRKASDKTRCSNVCEAEGIILGLGQHVRLYDEERLESELRNYFPEVHIVQSESVKYCIHPSSIAQSAAIAINHPDYKWSYILRKVEHPSAAEWKRNQNTLKGIITQ